MATCNASSMAEGTTTRGSSGLRLFGVQLDLSQKHNNCSYGSMNCSFNSSPALVSSSPPTNNTASVSPSSSFSSVLVSMDDKGSVEYLSDGIVGITQERKKGVPWSEEEHRLFLIGLEKLGKGDWRGISRNFVTTRTPTQVASHAQKFFLRRQSCLNTSKKRRFSLLDTVISSSEAAVKNGKGNSSLKDLLYSAHHRKSSLNLDFQVERKKVGIDLNHHSITDY